MNNQKGYTALELVVLVGIFISVSVIVGVVWVLLHFISKFW